MCVRLILSVIQVKYFCIFKVQLLLLLYCYFYSSNQCKYFSCPLLFSRWFYWIFVGITSHFVYQTAMVISNFLIWPVKREEFIKPVLLQQFIKGVKNSSASWSILSCTRMFLAAETDHRPVFSVWLAGVFAFTFIWSLQGTKWCNDETPRGPPTPVHPQTD